MVDVILRRTVDISALLGCQGSQGRFARVISTLAYSLDMHVLLTNFTMDIDPGSSPGIRMIWLSWQRKEKKLLKP